MYSYYQAVLRTGESGHESDGGWVGLLCLVSGLSRVNLGKATRRNNIGWPESVVYSVYMYIKEATLGNLVYIFS